MLVIADELLSVVHRLDLSCEEPVRLRARVTILTARGVAVLLGATDVLLHGHVLGGLAERDRVIAEIDHPWVHEAPPERRVREDALAARESLGRLQGHERRSRHALDPARDDEIGLARPDASRRVVHRFEAAAAEPVHGDTGHRLRQPREERCQACDVAVVLAGLVRGAEDDFIDLRVADVGVLEHRAYDVRREVVGADR